jgi:3-dehydroquinate synthase
VQTLKIDLGDRSYPILIGPGLMEDAALLQRHIPARAVLVVTNETVAQLYLPALLRGLAGFKVAVLELPDGERFKTLEQYSRIFDALVAAGINRDGAVLALGGGVIGDMAGFAAACYQRGIAYAQLPTTLLAQVDSAVGGKTGVNHPGGKNLIGAFHQPCCVISDTRTLDTLPDRELRAGLADVIKYGLISDAALFVWLENALESVLARDAQALAHIIKRSCEIKAAVVQSDEREHGQRAVLNFGHTFGHAIEAATGFGAWLHGEAVAVGMLMAASLSARLGWLPAGDVPRLHALIQRAGLPVEAPRIGAERARALMQMDKKVLNQRVRLILLRAVGTAVVTADYPDDALQATLAEYCG